MRNSPQWPQWIPRWLHCGGAPGGGGPPPYIGTGFFFAPVLALASPWPMLTTVLWIAIALAGLWLGLLGIAMATGLAIVLRSNTEIPEDYWRSIIDYPSPAAAQEVSRRRRRGSRPANV